MVTLWVYVKSAPHRQKNICEQVIIVTQRTVTSRTLESAFICIVKNMGGTSSSSAASQRWKQETDDLRVALEPIVVASEETKLKDKTDIFDDISLKAVTKISNRYPSLARRIWIEWLKYLETHIIYPETAETMARFNALSKFVWTWPDQFLTNDDDMKSVQQVWPWINQIWDRIAQSREGKQETSPLPWLDWRKHDFYRPFQNFNLYVAAIRQTPERAQSMMHWYFPRAQKSMKPLQSSLWDDLTKPGSGGGWVRR